MIQSKFTLRMKQGMHRRECESASHCIPGVDKAPKEAKVHISARRKKQHMYHIQCGYHQFPYQTSARVSKFVPRVSLHLVLQLFLEMIKEFPVLEI